MSDKGLGYIYHTGSGTSDPAQFQQLVTIDAPTAGKVIDSTIGRQGVYVLSEESVLDVNTYKTHVLPQPDNLTDVKYASAPKMEYRWRSKRFVLPGNATMAAAKVVRGGEGDVRIRIIVNGCCKHEQQVRSSQAFRLPSQIMGGEWEIELIGTARIFEVHIAPSMQELLQQ